MSHAKCPECDGLPSRQRAICRNEAGLPMAATNAYRRASGFAEFNEDGSLRPRAMNIEAQHKSPKLATPNSKCGTNLANLLKAVGIEVKSGCTCEEWIRRMNNWSVAENKQHRQETIDHLKERAAEEKMSIAATALTGLLIVFNGVRPTIGGLVDEAIRQSEISQRKGPQLIGQPIDRSKLQSHILYHVMPLKGETEWVWRRHLAWLREVRDQFNGRLIMGVVTPGKKDVYEYFSPDEVAKAVEGLGAEFITAPNDSRQHGYGRTGLGEGVLWPKMLAKLETTDPNQVSFYGHCKGVTRPGPVTDVPHRWATACFDTLFRNHDAAIDALDTNGICGPFLMPGGYKDGLPGVGSKFFFSGTFFAMRLADVFARNWKKLPQHYGCVEQMPRVLFDRDTEAACLFFSGVNNLYDEAYWNEEVQPKLNEWYANNQR